MSSTKKLYGVRDPAESQKTRSRVSHILAVSHSSRKLARNYPDHVIVQIGEQTQGSPGLAGYYEVLKKRVKVK